MTELSEKGISYTGGFFILIAFAVGGMFLGSLISMPIVMVMGGIGPMEFMDIMENPKYFREMQVMQTISAICAFFLPTIFAASLLSRKPLELTGFKGSITMKHILFTIVIISCALALSSSLGYLSYQIPFPDVIKEYFIKLESNYAKMAASLIRLDNPFELVLSIFVMAAVPAVCEETLFRGGLQNYMYRGTKKLWFSVIVVSIIFSAVHFSFFGFLSRLMLGIVLGLLYQYSGRLWLPIIAHFINNAAAVIAMYVQKSNGKPMEEILNDRDGSYLGFLAIPLLVFLFVKFKQVSSNNQTGYGV